MSSTDIKTQVWIICYVLTFTLHPAYKTNCGKNVKTIISLSHINGLLCKQIS